jgi:hypothetical protein
MNKRNNICDEHKENIEWLAIIIVLFGYISYFTIFGFFGALEFIL